MTQRIEEQIRLLPAVEAESHLFEVGLQMLRANFMPASAQPALEKGECGFNSIRVNVAPDIFAHPVTNHFVLWSDSHSPSDAAIGVEIVRVEHLDVLSDILAEEFLNRAACHVLGMEQPKVSIALKDANDRALFGPTSALSQSFAASANVGFINFQLSVHHRLVAFGHRSADSVAEIPCGLVADSKRPLNLAGRHAFLRFTEQQGSHEPFREGQVRIIEYRAYGDGELVVTVFAVEEFLFGFKLHNRLFAARALDASGPAETAQQLAATVVSREPGHYVC